MFRPTNPQLVPPPYVSAKDAVDWNTFFDAVNTAFRLHLKESPFGPADTPILVEDFPKDRNGQFDQTFDVILWTVTKSEMAPTDNAGKRVPNGLRLLGKRPSPVKSGYLEVSVGWWELLESEFQIYAKSNERANVLANWFHRFLMQYAFSLNFFKAYGVTYFRFAGRQPDTKSTDFGEDLYVRRLRYEARLSMQNTFDAKSLEEVQMLVSTPDGETDSFALK